MVSRAPGGDVPSGSGSVVSIRRWRLLGLSLFAWVLGDPCGANAAQADEDRRPNVVVILTDDQGYGDLGAYEKTPDVRTPHLDQLAREGVLMTSGYVTAPQCVPSRAGIITGTYQQRFGVDHNGLGPLPLGVRTLPERLKAAGYATGMVGKWHLMPSRASRRWVMKNMPDAERLLKQDRFAIPQETSAPYTPGARGFTDFFHGSFSKAFANYDLKGEDVEPGTIDTGMYRLDAQTQASLAFIRRHAGKRPFFLYLAYFGPHVPLYGGRLLEQFPKSMPRGRRLTLSMIAEMDEGVGKIMQELESRGVAENTLVFFVSDNGASETHGNVPGSEPGRDGSVNDPWVGEKGMLTEGGIRVPFVMRWKGTLPAGKVYDPPVSSLDVAATSLAVSGQEVPEELDGVNLIPYLSGKKQGVPHEYLYWRFWSQRAVRSGQWKYLSLRNSGEFLFDLESEEHEHGNVIAAHPEIAKRLKAKLESFTAGLENQGLAGNLFSEHRSYERHSLLAPKSAN